MSNVLTTASSLTCPHQGTVTASASHPLTVAGASVLTKDDVLLAAVENCTTSDTSSVKCTQVTTVTAGLAARLTVGGSQVLVEQGFTALTNGVVGGAPQPLTAAANQIQLGTA